MRILWSPHYQSKLNSAPLHKAAKRLSPENQSTPSISLTPLQSPCSPPALSPMSMICPSEKKIKKKHFWWVWLYIYYDIAARVIYLISLWGNSVFHFDFFWGGEENTTVVVETQTDREEGKIVYLLRALWIHSPQCCLPHSVVIQMYTMYNAWQICL